MNFTIVFLIFSLFVLFRIRKNHDNFIDNNLIEDKKFWEKFEQIDNITKGAE